MREHDTDYFENSRRATLVQQQYAIRNPLGFKHVGELCWGITASDGPGFEVKKIDGVERVFFDYVARGAPYGPDDGTIAPWAVVARCRSRPRSSRRRSPTWAACTSTSRTRTASRRRSIRSISRDGDDGVGWVSRYHFGINEGPTVLMIENYRSGMIWSLMRTCAPLVAGLRAAGFSGGWLA